MLTKFTKMIKKNPQFFVYAYFILVVGLFAYSFRYGVAPDEKVHYSAIEFYSQNAPKPFVSNQTSNFEAGELARSGVFLYYYVLGLLHRVVSELGINPLVILRLANVVMGLSSLIMLHKIAIFLGVGKKIRTVLLFVIASVPMYMVLSSGINYDNAVILIAITIAYLLLLLSKKPTITKSLALFCLIVVGPLVKFAMFPVSMVAGFYYIYLFLTKKHVKTKKRQNNTVSLMKIVLLSLTLFMVTILFMGRYGRNIVEYGRLSPACDQVLTVEQCKGNLVYKRTLIYQKAELEEPEINYIEYVPQWYELMMTRTYGVLAHKSFAINYTVVYIGLTLSMVIGVMFIRKFKFSRSTLYIPVVLLTYTTALISANIVGYKSTQEISLAVQGRYLFPVSFVFIVYIISLHNKTIQKYINTKLVNIAVLALIGFAFIAGPLNIRNGINYTWLRTNSSLVDRVFD